ncbi:NAD(P)-dependent oxidoreductase [Actinokineospora iranica]|uniref:3-hydroxyisobutyrate dehydrogenase n=1 Tax=Actinokineospora iranica TaxID=1271860 RepID=A0A1G6J271_9PSEU|nr:NAD(P)-binding domain-containing protein [Actinokineospora iranica]SDC12693.1 3-hydroxyisobutyrate dehydrogenase [Actinokineospora iranica]
MTAQPTPVTVLGLGPMGQALAGAFLAAGHPTTVWNRSPGKAEAVVARGARLADSAAAAIAASPLVIVCVIDYAAVRAIIEPAVDALRGRTLVNLTSDEPEQVRDLAAWASGFDYLDGSIMTPTITIGEPSARVLYSGPEDTFDRHRDALASIGGTATYLGADPGRAAAYDMALLDVFWTSMSGLVHAFALARAEGVKARDLAPHAQDVMSLLPVFTGQLAGEVDDGEHPGEQSSLRSAAAGMAHILRASRRHGLDTSVLAAALDIARSAIPDHGDEGFSRLAEVIAR